MTSPSSIFSFNTLRLPRSLPTGALFALVLLGGAELAARTLLAKRTLTPDPSLRLTLETRINEIKRTHPPLWFVGNSTLDWGVDAAQIEKLLDEKVIKLSHGSATLNASAAMLQFDIDNTGETPKQVVVTLTKDDLNVNGYRADFSKSYLDMASNDKLPSGDFLALQRARTSIRDKAAGLLEHKKNAKAEAPEPVKPYDGTPLKPTDTFEINLLKNYKLGTDWFAQLKAVCDRNHIASAIIVLMPPTDQYVAFHDRMLTSPKFAQIHQEVLAAIKANGMQVVDYWTRPRTDYAAFRDPYHLNPTGEAAFTRQLAADLKPLFAK